MQRTAFRLTIIAIAGVIGISSAQCFAEPPDSAARNLIEEFDIARNGDFLFVPITMDGKEYRFLVDTGCTLCFVDDSLKSRLTPTGRHISLAGKSDRVVYTMPDVRVGHSRIRVTGDAVCIDLSAFRELSGVDFYGIFGMTFLKEYVVRIDFDAGKLSLLKTCPELAADGLALTWHRLKIPELAMTIGKEKRIPFVIDTGLMGGKVACFVQTAHFDRLVDEGSVIVDDETFQEMTAHGISEFRAGRIVRLRIGGREHSALKVAEGDPSRLGLEFLSRYVVTFDFPNNRVFLKPGKRFAAEQPYDMSGLVLSRIGNDTVAIRVYDGSPADAAGLTEGQRILELDDKSVGDFTIFGLHAMLTDEGRVVRLLVQADDKPRELELKLADWQKVRRRAAGSDKR